MKLFVKKIRDKMVSVSVVSLDGFEGNLFGLDWKEEKYAMEYQFFFNYYSDLIEKGEGLIKMEIKENNLMIISEERIDTIEIGKGLFYDMDFIRMLFGLLNKSVDVRNARIDRVEQENTRLTNGFLKEIEDLIKFISDKREGDNWYRDVILLLMLAREYALNRENDVVKLEVIEEFMEIKRKYEMSSENLMTQVRKIESKVNEMVIHPKGHNPLRN